MPRRTTTPLVCVPPVSVDDRLTITTPGPVTAAPDVASQQRDHTRPVRGARTDATVPAPVEQPPSEACATDLDPSAGGLWTPERIRELGAVTSVATAAAIFRLSRTSAYELIRAGRFPIPVLRFGGRYRVSVPAILHALAVPDDDPPEPPT